MKEEMENETPRVTLGMTTKGGYSVLITLPIDSTPKIIESLFKTIEAADAKGQELGYTKPEKGGGFVKKAAEKDWTGKTCPKDGGRLYKMVTKSGKTMIKCENSRYDFSTKTASGCTYVEWGDAPKNPLDEFTRSY